MNREYGQIFDIENSGNAMIIWSVFHTKEVIRKGPYYFYEFMQKLRYRNLARFMFSQKIHSS